MKTKLIAMALMAGSTMFAGVRFGVGVNFGIPAPVAVVATPYAQVAPPFDGAYWVAPNYVGGRYVSGYWGGERHFDQDYRRVIHNTGRFDRDDRGRNFRR